MRHVPEKLEIMNIRQIENTLKKSGKVAEILKKNEKTIYEYLYENYIESLQEYKGLLPELELEKKSLAENSSGQQDTPIKDIVDGSLRAMQRFRTLMFAYGQLFGVPLTQLAKLETIFAVSAKEIKHQKNDEDALKTEMQTWLDAFKILNGNQIMLSNKFNFYKKLCRIIEK